MLLLLYLAASGVSVTAPKPLMPTNATIDGLAMTWKSPNLAIRIEPLDPAAFMNWIRAQGIDDSLLSHPSVAALLRRFAVFRISLYNLGEERMLINPEQIRLRNRNGIVGSMIQASDFLAAQLGQRDSRIEALAALFHQDTIELAPQQKVGRVVAFRPLDHKFPRTVQLLVSRIYYGIESLDFNCEYKVRYKDQ